MQKGWNNRLIMTRVQRADWVVSRYRCCLSASVLKLLVVSEKVLNPTDCCSPNSEIISTMPTKILILRT